MNKAYYQYAVDVTEGKVICGESIILACKRFLNDLQRDDLTFREDVVDRAITFIGNLKHFAGKSSG
jgi:phage terminase large subunit-like protein